MPWLNEELKKLRRKCRKAERLWRCSRLEVFLQDWKDTFFFQIIDVCTKSKLLFKSHYDLSITQNFYLTWCLNLQKVSQLAAVQIRQLTTLYFFRDRAERLEIRLLPPRAVR